MLQAHSFDFESKTFGKRQHFIMFWRKITESLLSSNGGFYTFAKVVLFWLLVFVARDWVITLSEIAYNVRNNLDEVLLAIVCTVYNGNILQKPFFFWKSLSVNCVSTCVSWKRQAESYLSLSIVFSVRINQCWELELIVNVGFGVIRFPQKMEGWSSPWVDQFFDQPRLVTFLQSWSG